jgi:hypothetical protein
VEEISINDNSSAYSGEIIKKSALSSKFSAASRIRLFPTQRSVHVFHVAISFFFFGRNDKVIQPIVMVIIFQQWAIYSCRPENLADATRTSVIFLPPLVATLQNT